MDERIELLLMSYDLTTLLEENDIEESYVLELLIDLKLISLGDYFR